MRVACRYVDLVQLWGNPAQRERHRNTLLQLPQKVRDRVTLRLGSHLLEDGLDSLLGRLLGREAGPLGEVLTQIMAGVLQIPLRLRQPVTAALGHVAVSL